MFYGTCEKFRVRCRLERPKLRFRRFWVTRQDTNILSPLCLCLIILLKECHQSLVVLLKTGTPSNLPTSHKIIQLIHFHLKQTSITLGYYCLHSLQWTTFSWFMEQYLLPDCPTKSTPFSKLLFIILHVVKFSI